MSKPLGLGMFLEPETGTIHMGVTRSDRATDQIWDAVEEAHKANWSFERLKNEVLQAWVGIKQQAADDAREDAF